MPAILRVHCPEYHQTQDALCTLLVRPLAMIKATHLYDFDSLPPRNTQLTGLPFYEDDQGLKN